MISKEELMKVESRKERFELSMLYMMLHGMPPYIDNLTLEDVKHIRNSVLHVTQSMDYKSQKENTEYFNIECGDKAYKDMIELYQKEKEERIKKKKLKDIQIKEEIKASREFKFDYISELNSKNNTLTQIMISISKAKALYSNMVGHLYKGMLANEINAALILFEDRGLIASRDEKYAYYTFMKYGIFRKIEEETTNKLWNR